MAAGALLAKAETGRDGLRRGVTTMRMARWARAVTGRRDAGANARGCVRGGPGRALTAASWVGAGPRLAPRGPKSQRLSRPA